MIVFKLPESVETESWRMNVVTLRFIKNLRDEEKKALKRLLSSCKSTSDEKVREALCAYETLHRLISCLGGESGSSSGAEDE